MEGQQRTTPDLAYRRAVKKMLQAELCLACFVLGCFLFLGLTKAGLVFHMLLTALALFFQLPLEVVKCMTRLNCCCNQVRLYEVILFVIPIGRFGYNNLVWFLWMLRVVCAVIPPYNLLFG
jgi:hypothetical protein